MNIQAKSIEASIDGRFIKYLNNAYPDAVTVNKKVIAKKVSNMIQQNRYHNSLPVLLIDYNKGMGVSRPVPLFSPEDYFVYYYCLKKLENKLARNRTKNTFGGWSLSGVARSKESAESVENEDSPGSSGINPAAGAIQYGEFNMRIKESLKEIKGKPKILEIDIANFYDTIRIDRLQREVRSVADKSQSHVVDLLFYFLSNSTKLLHSYRPQTTGIPQDIVGDCSRILANFYLQEYDTKMSRYCSRLNIVYLRYADDQLFIIPSGNSVTTSEVCREASKQLYRIGLNINQKKVKEWSKKDFVRYRCLEIYEVLEAGKQNAEQSPLLCRKFAKKSISVINNHHLKKDLKIKNGGLPLIKKIISLDINKLSRGTRSKVLDKILHGDKYTPYLQEYTITKLYKQLAEEERPQLIEKIGALLDVSNHSSFHYEIMKFKRVNKLPWKRHSIRVKMMTKEWSV